MRRTSPFALALPVTALVVGLWIVIACGLAGSPGQSAPSVSTPSQAAVASPAPDTFSPTPPAATPPPSVAPTSAGVPIGRLAVGDGPWITGWQGSYCWKGICADMAGPPHIEKLPSLKPTANDELTFSIDPPEGVFASWSATYSGADGKQHDLARGGSDADPDSTATAPPELLNATFSAPPAGDWTLTVSVRFSVGGDAIYAWHATVA